MGMKVGALQQDRIPEPVAQPQVNTHRCMHIRQQLFKVGFYDDFLLHDQTYKM